MKEWPPLWVAVGLLMSWGTGIGWGRAAEFLGWVLIALGLVLMLAAAFEMHRSKTTVIPHREPDALVTSGPFRWSRNPIYLGDALILLGGSLVWGSLLGFLFVPVFGVIVYRRFILSEEARLKAAFGQGYEEYAARVPRWIGPI